MSVHIILRNTAVLMTLLGASCVRGSDVSTSTNTSAAPAPARRDSAGVQIVENPETSEAGVPVWVVDSLPSVSIGSTAGAAEQLLVRIAHVTRTATGAIAAFDAGTSQLRFFDSTGKHLGTHGRAGDGPGEFRSAIQITALGGDTVMVVDDTRARQVWTSALGGHIETRPFNTKELRAAVTDTLITENTPQWISSDVIAWHGYRISADVRGPDGEPGFSHDLYYAINPAAKTVQLLADVRRERGRVVQVSRGTRELYPVQGIYPYFAAHPSTGRICAAQPRIAEVSCLAVNGDRMILRWKAEQVPYPNELREKAQSASLERSLRSARTAQDSATARADIEKMHAEREWIPHWLPLRNFAFDDDGNIWVLEHTRPQPGVVEQRRYRVFSGTGEHIAFATSFTRTDNQGGDLALPYHIGSANVIGVFQDADDVQRVGVFRIRK